MADPSGAKKLQSIRTLKDAPGLAEKRRELENLRHRDKVDWTLNREFYKGNQYAYWNKMWPNGGRLENEPVDEGDKPHYKVRLTNNLILPGVQHYVAQLTKNRPVIYATPDSGSDRDLKAAQLGEALFEYWWTDKNLGTKLQSAVTHAALSQGYWFISWDDYAGKQLDFMVDPQGQPLVKMSDGDLDVYRDELRQIAEQSGQMDPEQLIQEMTKTIYVGDVSVKVLPGENVILDPSAQTFEDAQYALVTMLMDPDEVKSRYPKAPTNLGADAVPGDESTALAGVAPREDRLQTVRRVYHLYVRPSALTPKGRYVCWVEGPDTILSDDPWPFPFTELPLVKFPGLERPDSPLDIPVTSPTRPLQKDINRTISQIVEHKNLTLKSQLLAPMGSLPNKVTNEPGARIMFNPIQGLVPQWRQIPDLPRYVFEHLQDLERRIDMVFNRIPSQRDTLPARIDSGSSIDLIQESVADQLSPVVQRLERALVRAGMLMLQLAQKKYIEPRFMKIVGPNGASQTKQFQNADLTGGLSLNVDVGSGLPRTRAGRQARIEMMLQNQLIDPPTALKYLDTADMSGLQQKTQLAEEQAYRTIEKLRRGVPLNPIALQQAQQQMQQALQDPSADLDGDGQPDSPQVKAQIAQQQIQQAAVAVQDYENPQVHIDVLTTFMSGVEYEALPPEIQMLFTARLDAMYQRSFQLSQFMQQMNAPVQKPRVNLQLKATSSAPVAGEILRDTGVQVQDEQVAEPPLDTWVTDDVTAPAVQDTGNTHLDTAQQLQGMQQTQDTHELKAAKAAHDASLAQTKTDQASADQQAAAARAEELHQQALRHAEEMHQARLKAANRPPAKTSGGTK